MVTANTESQRTAFTVSVDYRHGTTRASRPRTGPPPSRPSSTPTPGPPIWAGPVTSSPSATGPAASSSGPDTPRPPSTWCRPAGLYPAGVLCEIVSEDKRDGPPARARGVRQEARLPLISIADLVRYRRRKDKLVRRIAGPARIPTEFGDFSGYVYESVIDNEHHLAIVKGELAGQSDVLVRVHSECLTGDVLGSLRCDCGPQLHEALRLIADAGTGVVVYLRGHEGRGIGLAHKLRAYHLQEQGHDTVDANLELGLPVDNREYGIGAQILVDLGVTTMRLMTNNPMKYGGLEGFGLDIVDRVALEQSRQPREHRISADEGDRLGHIMEGLDDDRRLR